MKRLLAVLVAIVLVVTGCSSSSKKSSSSTPASSAAAPAAPASSAAPKLTGKITVYAASSLTGAFNTIKTQFIAANPGTDITFNFGPSSGLATMIANGAPVDVFASAAPANMASVVKAGAAAGSTNFVSRRRRRTRARSPRSPTSRSRA